MMELRAATLEDEEALRALYAALDGHHADLQPGFFRARPRARAYVHGLVIDEHAEILVAEADRTILGAITVRLYDTPRDPTMTPRRRVHLDDLIVRAERRREGIARRLMEAATAWARRRGGEQLVLTVWAGNDEALALYDGLGYGEVSRVLALDLDAGDVEGEDGPSEDLDR